MPAPAALAPHRPSRPRAAARPWARERRLERRLGRRLASGLTPAQAATTEGVPEAEIAALLADPAFTALVGAYRDLAALPEEQARERLRRLARAVFDEALIEGDVRVAAFILREEARGRDPADTLARGVLAAAKAVPPARLPTLPADARPRPDPPAVDRRDPSDRAAWRTAESLRAALLAEHAALPRAPATSAPVAIPAGTSAAPAGAAGVTRASLPSHRTPAAGTPAERVLTGAAPARRTLADEAAAGCARTADLATDGVGSREAPADRPPAGPSPPGPTAVSRGSTAGAAPSRPPPNRRERRRLAALRRHAAPARGSPAGPGGRGPP